jgi:LAS superfamily LD-carboxypeptidase LdcB
VASTATLDPGFRPWVEYLLRVAEYNGLRVQVTSTLRTRAQQIVLYQRWLQCSARGGRGTCLPAAPPGTSDHELGLAVDLVVNGDFRSAAQASLGAFWQSLGGRWGGAVDPVHFSV